MRSSKIVFTLPLLLAALPVVAATSFTGTGWLTGVPVPGILCTNGSGQVYLKGNVHTLRVLASDARITGSLEALPNVAFQSDGTRRFTGTAYSEVGTWDAATNFTASGGVWDLLYSGVTQTDGSVHYDIVGYGIGGPIDALRLELTADRGPGPTFDPSIPYAFSGTIKPAPVNTSVTLDDFNDGVLTNKWVPWSSGTPYLTEANGQLTVRGVWNRPVTDIVLDHAGAYWSENWSVPDGQTIEWRTEVIGMNPHACLVGMGVGTAGTRFYCLGLATNSIFLYRWVQTGGNTLLHSEPVTVRQTNIVLCLAVTRQHTQAVVTIRVEDRAAPGTVLYQTTYTDMAPLLSGDSVGLVVEPKPELQASDASASFDNFTKRTYEVPRVGIQRAVQLSFPTGGMNWAVESAPNVLGPYLPVQATELPGMQTLTVPANDIMRYFRPRQAP